MTIQGYTLLFTLPEEYRPKITVRGLCNLGDNAYSVNSVAYITVGVSGDVYVQAKDNNTYTVCYTSLAWTV